MRGGVKIVNKVNTLGAVMVVVLLSIFLFIGFIPFNQQVFAQDSTATDSSAVQVSDSLSHKKLYKKFRNAFNKVAHDDTLQKDVSKDPELILTGFVLNETLTRMGNNFYNLFYQYWEAPPNAGYFTIIISEKPTPGFGSMVLIKMNHEVVFKSRLQPKYSYTERLSQYAVRRVRRVLQQKANVKNRLAGF